MIECDYHKNYTNHYKNDNLKNILRQILVEMDFIGSRFYKNGVNVDIKDSKDSKDAKDSKDSKDSKSNGISNTKSLKEIL